MSENTIDPRFESLLRDALGAEAASLPLRVTRDQILERAVSRGGVRVSPRFRLPRLSMAVAIGAAAVVFVVAGAVGLNLFVNQQPGIGAASPSSSAAAASSEPTSSAPTSGGMWPQSSLDEVRAAQEHADAGDPDYTWQLGPRFSFGNTHLELELVDRFIREVLGWEAYRYNPFEGGGVSDGWEDGHPTDQRYLRCAPGRTNPLYPAPPDSEQPGDSCAPTLDDFRYESVSLDLAQLVRQGSDGIWVVSRWELTAPFAQVDPAPVEAQATERLEAFLAARIAGTGAEGRVQVDGYSDVPLLYLTTSGARYERYEIERVDGPRWPDGGGTFRVRLFADGDAIVVDQEIRWQPSAYGLSLDAHSTTENGQPVVLSHTSSDGEVSVSAPSTWDVWLPGKGAGRGGHEQALDVWFGLMKPGSQSGTSIGFVDPVAYDAWCADNGGSPLLTAPADAAAIAQQLMADPDFETTEPVTTTIGGLEAVSMDVALAPGGEACIVGRIEISRWIHELVGEQSESRLRLYLVDLPEDMSVDTLAITVLASEARFEEVIAETARIIESIEFHP